MVCVGEAFKWQAMTLCLRLGKSGELRDAFKTWFKFLALVPC